MEQVLGATVLSTLVLVAGWATLQVTGWELEVTLTTLDREYSPLDWRTLGKVLTPLVRVPEFQVTVTGSGRYPFTRHPRVTVLEGVSPQHGASGN
ncbi:hypothetical protein OCL90_13765, partial [Enterococcus faecalis]